MKSVEHTITPDEISALEKYITLLHSDSQFYREQRNLPQSKYDPVILTAARNLLEFHKNQIGGLDPYISFEGQHYYFRYLIEGSEQSHGVLVMLHDQHDLLLHLIQLYTDSLHLTAKHQILKKPLAEMTGYDLHKLAMYVLADFSKNKPK